MPKRKSDAEEADAHLTDSNQAAGGSAPEEAPFQAEVVPGEATPADSAPESSSLPEFPVPESPAPETPSDIPTLETPDVAAEPGSPDPDGPPPPADPIDNVEPYREPDFVLPADSRPPEPAVMAAALPEPPHGAEPVEEAHDGEEEGSSLASRLLMAVLLLLLGGGVALWAAPKLAPHLPAGMSGVAAWLTPGASDAEARIAALEAEFGGRVAELEARLGTTATSSDVDARVSGAVDAAASRLDGEIAAVRAQLTDLGAGSDVPQQVARLASALDGQSAELATLKSQIETVPAGGDTAEVDVYRAELDGVRAEVGTLQEQVAGLVTRVDQAVQAADRQVSEAQTRVTEVETAAATRLTAAEAASNLALIGAAVASGAPFEAPLKALEGHPGVTVPPDLAAAAPTGVATLAALRDDFPDAAHAAIRSSIMASAGDGVLARTRAFFDAQIASRSLTPQAGASPDAVLSRVEDRLRHDDLAGAINEAEALPSEAQAALAPWLDAARLREGATEGLATLAAALPPVTN